MTTNYSAQEITVLKDLEPVQIRPGMYTDTTRPNHLAQEVIDKNVIPYDNFLYQNALMSKIKNNLL